MSGGIYLRQGSQLVAMLEQPYATEDILQTLIADYPDLLAGDQTSGVPRRWLLLEREAPVGDDHSAGRWSIDHLFVDQDATPTIVEVKRSSDTRIRREVVGQMLEYAANAVSYWRAEELRSRFESKAQQAGQDPDALLVEALGDDIEPDDFWGRLRANLAASTVRLVFVADQIPSELRRLVEFLNEQMQAAEVLAVEIKQYVAEDGELQTLVPRLVGQTEKAKQTKVAGSGSSRWDRPRLIAALEEGYGQEIASIASRILEWSDGRGLHSWYGRGEHTGSVTPGIREGRGCYPFVLYSGGKVEIMFQELSKRAPFDDAAHREDLRARLNAISGVSLGSDVIERRAKVSLSALKHEEDLEKFLSAMGWVFAQVTDSGSLAAA